MRILTFKPAPEVRTYARQIAHVADDQYNLCAPARGETRKDGYTAIEDSLHTKTELVAALRKAFEYCDGAYDALTDASLNEPTPSKTGRTKFGMLNWNVWHTWARATCYARHRRARGLLSPRRGNSGHSS